MNFEEWVAKPLLADFGIKIPRGHVCDNAASVKEKFQGPSVIKAQVPTGARGKAGGIKFASTASEAFEMAKNILAMSIDGHRVSRVLVEPHIDIRQELYAAILNDRTYRCPTLLFSSSGGIDIEDTAIGGIHSMASTQINILEGLTLEMALSVLQGTGLAKRYHQEVANNLVSLYQAYRSLDAELLEVNPLVITQDDEIHALDCKFTLDDSALKRQDRLSQQGSPDPLTELESEAQQAGLRLIELDGNVGILANGAGLTMTTMDAVMHYGGEAANFLEIGGDAYTKAEKALTILLKHPHIKSLLVNFCGAFARTDVMTRGVVTAWKSLRPKIPIFFSIHGTGEEEAIDLVRVELGLDPFDNMDEAVLAAIEAARRGGKA